MEATGVYGSRCIRMEDGFRVILSIRQRSNACPAQDDVSDCAWLAQVLDHGMVAASFIPPREIRELRDLVRYRVSLSMTILAKRNRLTRYCRCRPQALQRDE